MFFQITQANIWNAIAIMTCPLKSGKFPPVITMYIRDRLAKTHKYP